jgi:hypothetical protein
LIQDDSLAKLRVHGQPLIFAYPHHVRLGHSLPVESVASLAMSVIATKAELFALAAAQPVIRVNGAAQDVIQAPKPEPRNHALRTQRL